jgi:hypothetical protein
VDDEGENITLLWVPAHMERPGNETVVEEILLQELINWIKTEALNKKNMAKK